MAAEPSSAQRSTQPNPFRQGYLSQRGVLTTLLKNNTTGKHVVF